MNATPEVGFIPGYLASEQVADALEVPYRSLMNWVQGGLVNPRAAGFHRQAPRLWSKRDTQEARVIARLRRDGVSLDSVRRAMECLRRETQDPFSSGKYLILGVSGEENDVAVMCEEGDVISCLKQPGRRLTMLVDLEEMAADIPTT